MQLEKRLRGLVPPSHDQCVINGFFVGFAEVHVGRAPSPPSSGYGREAIRLGARESILLVVKERDHPARIVGIAEGGEDLAADTEVRMAHVRLLAGIRERKSEPPEIFSGDHVIPKLFATPNALGPKRRRQASA